ncbi:MAG: Co2+/Mg2+ efflux protein ApaG [Deltaproteobacteria bacterium]|nr:Co2+/Mg2+ efflux protein ApaG [Deltaproteobacteria bacterium]
MERSAHRVEVSVSTEYVAERSRPADGLYFFAYTITITNEGSTPVQLLSRHWVITDAVGRVDEVRGPGVVGQQPLLLPGDSFTYTSGCPLPTPIGAMRGSYQMVDADGESFEAEIPSFTLAETLAIN